MITKIKSTNVPVLLGRPDDHWIEILDHTKVGQLGQGGFVNVRIGETLQGNHMSQEQESITYDQNGYGNPNYCRHTSTLRKGFENLDELCSGKRGCVPEWDYRYVSNWPWELGMHYEFTRRWLPNFGGRCSTERNKSAEHRIDDTEAVTRAIANVRSGMLRPMFNLPQAVVELRDVPRTMKSVLEMGQAINSIRRFLTNGSHGGNLRINGRQLLSDRWGAAQNLLSATKGSISDVAKAYLTYQFGIRPTTQDVRAFIGLKWSRKQQGRTTELWFESRRLLYKEGQKLRCPYSLGGEPDLPSLPSFRFEERVDLFRDYHSDVGIMELRIWNALNSDIRCRAQSVAELHGLVFAEVVKDNLVAVPAIERFNYSGGPLSTIYETTKWTWVIDSVCDVGRYVKTLERMALPSEYRPKLKFGTWGSTARMWSTWVPVFDSVGIIYDALSPCDPLSGYGGWVHMIANLGRGRWKRVLKHDMEYIREPILANGPGGILDKMTDRIPFHVPGRYMLGPACALLAQFAAGNTPIYRNSPVGAR